MPLKHIGNCDNKKVYVTPYSDWRLSLRHVTYDEALKTLVKREVSYPVDKEGRQKIRSMVGAKKTFLTIVEDDEKIIIITGGEA